MASRLIPDVAHRRRRTHLAGAGGGRPEEQGAFVPTQIETAAYQFGVRLRQCAMLADDLFSQMSATVRSPWADQVVWIQHSISRLEAAFNRLVATASPEDPLSQVGTALIRACHNLWEEWSDTRTVELIHFRRHSPFQENLRRLTDVALRVMSRGENPKGRAETWFRLGHAICTGFVDDTAPKDGPAPKWSRLSPDEEELEKMLAQTGIAFDELCPQISDEQADTLLPYDPERYGMWFRIEAGLIQLLPKFGAQPAADTAASTETLNKESLTAREGAPEAHERAEVSTSSQQSKLRLRVDVEKRIAYWDGEPINLERDDVAKFVAALVEAKGGWVSPKDIIRRFPGLEGFRPSRLKKRIPEPIRGLVETQDAKGSKISMERLLPPDLLTTLWPDQT